MMIIMQTQNLYGLETKISYEMSEENDNGKYTETVNRLQKAW